MSATYVPTPTKRSNPKRIAELTAALNRWEGNLREQYDEARPDAPAFTFDEARRWSFDSQLDLINEVRDLIA